MEFEYRFNHPQLGLRWIYGKGRRIRDKASMFGVVLDVTDRKKSEQTIRQIERSMRDREASWELLRAQDEERRHIARELHDSAGQTLALLGMNLGLLAETVKDTAPETARSADDALELVEQLCAALAMPSLSSSCRAICPNRTCTRLPPNIGESTSCQNRWRNCSGHAAGPIGAERTFPCTP